jgi:DNA-binding NarL/FixJ family response regulator
VQAGSTLIGRSDEVEAVAATLQSLDARSGGFLVISGEPGIGKSRMLEELAAEAQRRGHLVLAGRAAEFEREVPFAAWVDAMDAELATLDRGRLARMGVSRLDELGAIFPSLDGDGSDGLQEDRFRAHRAVRELLDGLAATRPVVVVLDDLQWADAASLELLAALARRPPAGRVLVAVAHRPSEALRWLRGGLERATGARAVDLDPLDPDEAAALVPDRVPAGLLPALLHEAGGNPFYLQQLARAPAAAGGDGRPEVLEGGFTVPAGVAASLAEELGDLPEPTRRLLRGAAVAGEPFDLWLAAACAPLDLDAALDALDAALAVDLVRPTPAPGQFLFRHPLVRRAIYAGAGEGFRLAAHRRAAAALAERGIEPSARAHHVARSAQPGDEDGIAVLLAAAERHASSAPASAAAWFGAALRLLAEAEPERRAEVLVRRARALLAAGHLEESHDALVAALELAPPEGVAEPVALLAEIEQWMGRPDAAEERLAAARARLDEGDPKIAALLALRLMFTDIWNGRRESAGAHGQAAFAAAQRAGDEPVLAAVEATLGQLVAHVDVTAARGLLDTAAARVATLDDDRLADALDTLYSLGWGATHLEAYEEGIAYFARGLAIARRHGVARYLMTFRTEPAEPLLRSGRVREALAVADDAVEASRLHPSPRFLWWALWLRSTILLRTGEVDAAEADLDEADVVRRDIPPQEMVDIWMGYQRAALLSVRGDHAAAIICLERAGGGADLDLIPPNDRQWAWEIQVAAALDRDDLDRADAWVREAEAGALASGLHGLAGFAARCRAHVELARGDADAALAAAAASVASFRALGTPFDAARSRALEGELLAGAGRRSEAVAALQEAEATLHELGVERFRAEAARALRRLGRRTPPRAGAGAPAAGGAGLEALSARELEIAELVHRELSNREIAATLYLSEKTVQTHLRNIFVKLGVSSRVAVAVAIEQARESG